MTVFENLKIAKGFFEDRSDFNQKHPIGEMPQHFSRTALNKKWFLKKIKITPCFFENIPNFNKKQAILDMLQYFRYVALTFWWPQDTGASNGVCRGGALCHVGIQALLKVMYLLDKKFLFATKLKPNSKSV